nr:MAG: hypothetical protein H4Bulk477346_000001 [Mitovirus sp.]
MGVYPVALTSNRIDTSVVTMMGTWHGDTYTDIKVARRVLWALPKTTKYNDHTSKATICYANEVDSLYLVSERLHLWSTL